jgi:hypothetical protein
VRAVVLVLPVAVGIAMPAMLVSPAAAVCESGRRGNEEGPGGEGEKFALDHDASFRCAI